MPRPRPGLLIDTHVPESPWDQDAACRGRSPELTRLFYADDEPSVAEAKRVCAGCACRATCLERALAFREPDGVWGGMTRPERDALLRRRKLALKVA